MGLIPKSKKARRRLLVLAVAAPILCGAAALAFFAMGDAVSFFYSPAQAKAAHVTAGRTLQLGGLVAKGSVVKSPDGSVSFVARAWSPRGPMMRKACFAPPRS